MNHVRYDYCAAMGGHRVPWEVVMFAGRAEDAKTLSEVAV
jgi:hypothetical protein